MKRFLVLLVALAVIGCASVPPDRQVLNTIQIIRTSAISTMTVIGQMYQLKQITEAQKTQAEDIYNKLQVGCQAVAAAASTVTTIQAGADLTTPLQQLADQLKALLLQFQLGGAK